MTEDPDYSAWTEAGYRRGWNDRDQLNDPAYPDLVVDRVAALARDAQAAYRAGIVEAPGSVPCDLAAGDLIDRTCACGHSGTVHHRTDQGGFVCDMCPLVGQVAADRPLREWLADRFDTIDRALTDLLSGDTADGQSELLDDRKPLTLGESSVLSALSDLIVNQSNRLNTGLASLGNRFDGLVDVVLRQENRLTEQINKAKGRDGLGLDGDWLEHQFEAIDRRFERILEQIGSVHHTDNPDEVTLTLAGYAAAKQAEFERGRQQGDADRAARAQSEYDRGVAAGRASISNLAQGAAYQRGLADGRDAQARDCTTDHNHAEQVAFERGLKIGKAEREAELLEAGWTPPGAVISWADSTLGTTEPTDADLWETALQIAGSQRNRRELETETVRADAVWFYRELKAGPPPDLIDPADQAQETRAAYQPTAEDLF